MQRPIIYLNSNDGTGYLGIGKASGIKCSGWGSLDKLQEFLDVNKGKYVFGFLSYELKNEIENLKSSNPDHLNFPDLYFWIPDAVVQIHKEHIDFLQGQKTEDIFNYLNYFIEEETDQNFHHYPFKFKSGISKETYLEKIKLLKEHIQRGDIYEINFCQEYYAENVILEFPLDTYFKLNKITRAPFSTFLHIDEYSVFCGSPERFLKKDGNKLISQPIKGTSGRGKTEEEDEHLKNQLKNDPKERAENVMIVDLVRNDLSKVAEKNSVAVDELCGIYSFETVHQMISTVSCDLKAESNFTDIIRATFPMGSMTGAPKIRAMELIEETENFKRGLYSGSIGYIKPDGDFDFNVVIRSLLYNEEKKIMSCSVGSAITIGSDPEKEYEECRIKVERILQGMNE